MLLDITLPDQSGFALLEDLRAEDIAVPTIFLTGKDLETAKVKALELGGDDYVTKPFGYAELVARIRAVLRRSESRDDLKITKNARVIDAPFEIYGGHVQPGRLEILFDGNIEKIGRKELGILSYLQDHEGIVITRKALIHAVWGIHADVKSRSLDQYIVKIRDLFKRNGRSLDAFRTVHGVGYIFDPSGQSSPAAESE